MLSRALVFFLPPGRMISASQFAGIVTVWVASFAPHIITLTDKPAETEPETTQAQTEAVTTEAQTTGGSGSTSPSTGDSTVWIAFGVVALLAAAAIVIAVRKVRD